MKKRGVDDRGSVNHISQYGLHQALLLSIRMMPMQDHNAALYTHSPSSLSLGCYNNHTCLECRPPDLSRGTRNVEPLVNGRVDRRRGLVLVLGDVQLGGIGALVAVRDRDVGAKA